jgi:hypothetical protein
MNRKCRNAQRLTGRSLTALSETDSRHASYVQVDQRARERERREQRARDQHALDTAPFTAEERGIALRLAELCGLKGKITAHDSYKCPGGAVSGPYLFHEQRLPKEEWFAGCDIRRTWIELPAWYHRQWLMVYQRWYRSGKRTTWAHTAGVVPGPKPGTLSVCLMDQGHVVLQKRIRPWPVLVGSDEAKEVLP